METIRINPGCMVDTLALRATSALASCTDIDSDAAGMFIAMSSPRPSSGETLLWDVLAWLNGGTSLPNGADLRAGLDSANLAAVERAISPSGRSVA